MIQIHFVQHHFAENRNTPLAKLCYLIQLGCSIATMYQRLVMQFLVQHWENDPDSWEPTVV